MGIVRKDNSSGGVAEMRAMKKREGMGSWDRVGNRRRAGVWDGGWSGGGVRQDEGGSLVHERILDVRWRVC